MHFEEKLKIYADLLVCHGLNVQPGQVVNITSELIHKDLVKLIVQSAYRRGAKYVNVDFVDPFLAKIRVEDSHSESFLQYVPPYIPQKYDNFITEGVCVLRLTGSEEPDLLSSLSPKKVNDMQHAFRQSIKRYYQDGVGKSRIQWTVAAASTPKWGKKVFPELEAKEAHAALWEQIFHICRADQPDCLEIWKRHNKALKERAKRLSDLKIQKLHFTGPGTDLEVFLTPQAIFTGGGSKTKQGVEFEANIPTEECFTTPDFRLTQGKVRVTRPVLVNGEFVKDLEMEFKNGEIVNFSASQGKDNFASYINNDPGAKRLGEVSLVGIDSPIYQSKRVFQEILFDENAACHIAVGFAYPFCLEGGTEMNPDELQAIGCNVSQVHTDFMISSEEVDVTATTYEGQNHQSKVIQLLKRGEWVHGK